VPIFAASTSSDQQTCTQEELAAGIRTALDRKANIINISASQQTDLLALSHELSGALQAAAGADTLVVAAAGNQGCACDTIPASVAGVLAVGAHNEAGDPLLSSNWGPGQRTQGVIAPGSNVPGACVGGGLCRATGSSFATATVSGIAGLLMSMDVERGAKPSGRRVRKVLLQSCVTPAPDQVEMASTHLSGRLDVSRALDLMQGASAPINKGEGRITMSNLAEAEAGERHAAPSAPAGAALQGMPPRHPAEVSSQPIAAADAAAMAAANAAAAAAPTHPRKRSSSTPSAG
jgi:Subtilase family